MKINAAPQDVDYEMIAFCNHLIKWYWKPWKKGLPVKMEGPIIHLVDTIDDGIREYMNEISRRQRMKDKKT